MARPLRWRNTGWNTYVLTYEVKDIVSLELGTVAKIKESQYVMTYIFDNPTKIPRVETFKTLKAAKALTEETVRDYLEKILESLK